MNRNAQRLNADIKRVLSVAVTEVKSSTVKNSLPTVTRTELTTDLSYCTVYVSGCDSTKADKFIKELTLASGFLKSRIADGVKMRIIPELRFVFDDSLDYYEKINGIINSEGFVREKTNEE
ncbi:MAG: 30S ribosome-binding factor RbfA [Oscillospiraceae bacterium]|jgi:ribosome-binding factor A|nr:30S ribosome-binding factor RbfA [Oscillospiraceae bacterium]